MLAPLSLLGCVFVSVESADPWRKTLHQAREFWMGFRLDISTPRTQLEPQVTFEFYRSKMCRVLFAVVSLLVRAVVHRGSAFVF